MPKRIRYRTVTMTPSYRESILLEDDEEIVSESYDRYGNITVLIWKVEDADSPYAPKRSAY